MANKAIVAAEDAAKLATAKVLATEAVAEAAAAAAAAMDAAEAATVATEAAEKSAEEAMKFHVWWLQEVRDNTMILINAASIDGFIAVFAALIFYLAYKRRKPFFDRYFNYRFKR